MRTPAKIVLGVIALCVVVALTQIDFNAKAEESPKSNFEAPEMLPEVTMDTPELANFNVALKTANLTDTLTTAGPFTIFAPADTAFSNLPSHQFSDLMTAPNKAPLRRLLQKHIVAGRYSLKDLQPGDTLQTLAGSPLVISQPGDTLKVNGATILSANVEAANGIIHTLQNFAAEQ